MMKYQELDIIGCAIVTLPQFKDERGEFVKTFNSEMLTGTPLSDFTLREEFYSKSTKDVLRGLHFQTPPCAHNKLVCCIEGVVLDFFIDLRGSSGTYGKSLSLVLSSDEPRLLYLPKGVAHGFLTKSDEATLVYKTDFPYAPENDSGIHWSSIDLDIDESSLIVSERDKAFVKIEDFESPFI